MNMIRAFIGYVVIGYLVIGLACAAILHFVFYEGDKTILADAGYVNTLVGMVVLWPMLLLMFVLIVLAAACNAGC